jgi:D-aminopeptidase
VGARGGLGGGRAGARDLGRAITTHGGGLRGWRSNRLYAPSERVSVVVMFNHLSPAHEAAGELFAAILGETRPATPRHDPPPWLGAYVEPQTGLATRIEWAGEGQVRLRFGHSAELVEVRADGSAGAEGARLRKTHDGLWMDRPQDNQTSRLRPLNGGGGAYDVAGRYRSPELDAEVTVADAGGALYGAFSGFLGQGRMELLDPVGPDIWTLPCPRALDFTPPGDWTLAFERDGAGAPRRVRVGCWLARNLVYDRVA